MIKPSETLIGVRIPSKLKKEVYEYCDRNGIKMKYFITEAIKEKLQELAEDAYDNAILDERLKKAEFVSEEEMNKYFRKRKQSK